MCLQSYDFSVILRAIRHKKQTECPRNLEYSAIIRIFAVENKRIEEFYMLPHNGKLYKYDRMAINMIVDNVKGGLSFCDVAVSDDLEAFNANYLHLTETISQT